MWFWLSLVAIFFWSGSDVFSKKGSPSEDKYSHWKLVIAVGSIMGLHAGVMLLLAAITKANPAFAGMLGETLAAELPVDFSLGDIITYLPASAMYILSMILGYVGLRYVMLSVSTPICNSSGAVVAILCWLVLKQSMSGFQLAAVVLISLGILLLSIFEKQEDDKRTALAEKENRPTPVKSFIALVFPLLYCVIDALGTFVDGWLLYSEPEDGGAAAGFISECSANIAYELTFLMMAVFAFVYVVIIKRQKLSLKAERPKLVAGVCETAGQLAYIYALAGNTIVAAPMISSYCVFSLVWARLLLKEKLTSKHYIALAVSVAGIVLMGISEEL